MPPGLPDRSLSPVQVAHRGVERIISAVINAVVRKLPADA
jgi:hypothetical protein